MNPKIEIVIDLLSEVYNLPKESIQPEFFDFLKIVQNGAKKYSLNGWLEANGVRCSHTEMCDSMFHHLADVFGHNSVDKDSQLAPHLHLACRALMLYTRRQRNIVHEKDTQYKGCV